MTSDARIGLGAALIAMALVGCQTTPKGPDEPVVDRCNASLARSYLGKQPTDDVIAAIKATGGGRTVRTIYPGDVVTMDYREDRLNIEIGEDGRIKRFRCG